jgi:hypothetical protein
MEKTEVKGNLKIEKRDGAGDVSMDFLLRIYEQTAASRKNVVFCG